MDLFERDGSYLGSIQLPPPVKRFEIQSNYLIAYGESDIGESIVSLYTFD